MLRQTRMHHVQLSSMADLKANMLLTMSSVVLTLSVPHLKDEKFKWPALILMFFCLLTVILAAYTVMPKMPFWRRHGEPLEKRRGFNILFFGDFFEMTFPEYEQAMEEILNDPSKTYEAQVREVYSLGTFLARKKYRYLRLAYISFLTGLIASGIAALVAIQ